MTYLQTSGEEPAGQVPALTRYLPPPPSYHQQAEAARNEADRLRREAQAEAHAAISAAEAERSTRAEAEGLSETLRQDGERRARVFNNAVKAAIGKVGGQGRRWLACGKAAVEGASLLPALRGAPLRLSF